MSNLKIMRLFIVVVVFATLLLTSCKKEIEQFNAEISLDKTEVNYSTNYCDVAQLQEEKIFIETLGDLLLQNPNIEVIYSSTEEPWLEVSRKGNIITIRPELIDNILSPGSYEAEIRVSANNAKAEKITVKLTIEETNTGIIIFKFNFKGKEAGDLTFPIGLTHSDGTGIRTVLSDAIISVENGISVNCARARFVDYDFSIPKGCRSISPDHFSISLTSGEVQVFDVTIE